VHLSGPVHLPPFSHIWVQTADNPVIVVVVLALEIKVAVAVLIPLMTWLLVSAMYKKLVSDAELSVLLLTKRPAIPLGRSKAARVAGWSSRYSSGSNSKYNNSSSIWLMLLPLKPHPKSNGATGAPAIVCTMLKFICINTFCSSNSISISTFDICITAIS